MLYSSSDAPRMWFSAQIWLPVSRWRYFAVLSQTAPVSDKLYCPTTSCSLRHGTTHHSAPPLAWRRRSASTTRSLFLSTSADKEQHRRSSRRNLPAGQCRSLTWSSLGVVVITSCSLYTVVSTVGDRAFPVPAACIWISETVYCSHVQTLLPVTSFSCRVWKVTESFSDTLSFFLIFTISEINYETPIRDEKEPSWPRFCSVRVLDIVVFGSIHVLKFCI